MPIRVSDQLILEFFEKFARFEAAMKESEFCTGGESKPAKPDWTKFDTELAGNLGAHVNGSKKALVEAMKFFLGQPPEVQISRNRKAVFERKALIGKTDGAMVLCAVRRVRNNLFHGGKHTDHSPEEHDQTLLRHAITVLDAAAALDHGLNAIYVGLY
jgi:hypothetical protein